jgi:hypothetical protein
VGRGHLFHKNHPGLAHSPHYLEKPTCMGEMAHKVKNTCLGDLKHEPIGFSSFLLYSIFLYNEKRIYIYIYIYIYILINTEVGKLHIYKMFEGSETHPTHNCEILFHLKRFNSAAII